MYCTKDILTWGGGNAQSLGLSHLTYVLSQGTKRPPLYKGECPAFPLQNEGHPQACHRSSAPRASRLSTWFPLPKTGDHGQQPSPAGPRGFRERRGGTWCPVKDKSRISHLGQKSRQEINSYGKRNVSLLTLFTASPSPRSRRSRSTELSVPQQPPQRPDCLFNMAASAQLARRAWRTGSQEGLETPDSTISVQQEFGNFRRPHRGRGGGRAA